MLIVKIMSTEEYFDDDPRKTYMVYGNVASVGWIRNTDGSCMARMYIRDETKTVEVSGFSEHEVLVDVPAYAYVMNERGKTVASFCGAGSYGHNPTTAPA